MIKTAFYLLILAFVFAGCKQNKWDVDISNIELQTQVKRFDKTIFEIDYDSVWKSVPLIEAAYANFFTLYNQAVINIGGTNQVDYADKLVYFLTDPYISEAYKEVKINDYSNEFNNVIDGFKRYKYHFPEKQTPNIYTHISGFNQSIVIDSGIVSISLDKYLGADSKFYTMLRTPMYLRNNMHKQKIPSDVLFAWALTEFAYDDSGDKLSNRMIYYGKIHVLLDAFLPHTPDTLKWGFTDTKLDWCYENERQMWLYLVEKKLLFSSDFKEMKRFIDDGPFTTPFSKQSPSRTGRWLGYQIVNSYLKHNPNISLKELMTNTNYQQILNDSKYKP